MKFSTLSLSLLVLISLWLPTGLAKDLAPTKEHETIARLTSTIISRQHYRQHSLDDRISLELYKEYFKILDPNKMYFTKQDVESFSGYKTKLDDGLVQGNVNFAFQVYNFLLHRLDAYEKFADEAIDKGFDFSKDEQFEYDRTDAKWAESLDELKDVWRKKIKNDILTFRLMDRATKEEAAKHAKENPETPKTHPSWNNKTPKERVKKRIAQYLNYLRENEPIEVLQLYLTALASVYDPHSVYMSPRREEDFNISMRLSLVGIGAVLTTVDGYTKIVRIIPGGPAQKDGKLKAEDRIIAVAQGDEAPVDVIDMPLSKVVSMIRGKKDTKVALTVLDGNKGLHSMPKVITLTRDEVKLKEQEAKGEVKQLDLGNGKKMKIGVIELPSFYMDFKGAYEGKKDYKSSTRDVRNLLNKFAKEGGVDGLIMDLRSNSGGSLHESIKLTGLFIKDGPVVQVRNSRGEIDVKKDTDGETSYDGPVLILLNRLSASAAEIFAGAMRDYNRAILVGDSQTHGKGTVQTIYDLKQFLAYLGADFPAGSVKFTNAKFYRINGSSTQLEGVHPDIVFPSFTDSADIGEKELDHALPWDTITPAQYDLCQKSLKAVVTQLKQLTQKRQQENPKFKLLKQDIDEYQKIKDRKAVTLNEEKRWTEYQSEKKLRDERAALMNVDEDDKDKKAEDLYLDESLRILQDYIKLDKQATPAVAVGEAKK